MRHVRGLIESPRQTHAAWELALETIELSIDLVPNRLDRGTRSLGGRHEHRPPAVEAGSVGGVTIAPGDLRHVTHAHEPAVPPSDDGAAHLGHCLVPAPGPDADAFVPGVRVAARHLGALPPHRPQHLS